MNEDTKVVIKTWSELSLEELSLTPSRCYRFAPDNFGVIIRLMTTFRKIVFRNEEIYHVYNRGIERRTIFSNKREYDRAKQLVKFYRHKNIPLRFSQVMQQPEDTRMQLLDTIYKSERFVDILSYCLMPNDFHFMLKQNTENGVATFVFNFSNAYTKYFNTKHERIGPLLQGIFNAVIVETDEQLLHLSRYIHLNPVASSVIKEDQLVKYVYSSYMDYLSLSSDAITERDHVLSFFKSPDEYQKFVMNQVDYAKN